MAKNNSKNIIPISDTQAAVGAGVIISFFVLWALIAGVGDAIVCWIGGKANLSGWVQAVGSIATIYFSLKVSTRQMEAQRTLQNEQVSSAREAELKKEIRELKARKLRGYRSLFRKIASAKSRLRFMEHVISLDTPLDVQSLINSSKFVSDTLSIDSITFGIEDDEVLDAIDRIRSLVIAIGDKLNEAVDRKLVNNIDKNALSKNISGYCNSLTGVNAVGQHRVLNIISAEEMKKWQNDAKQLRDVLDLGSDNCSDS
ncbi:hypothetical protein [Delftia acidovorans]|uniref:hypothetical protein n=1 Tax=Delftia acidovorans TaxID=80866 RepID=UPI0028AAA421|nr:hypothetical protein [Delftia acidovorans]